MGAVQLTSIARRLRVATGLVALLTVSTATRASDTESLPEAAKILDRFVEVTGGKEAHGKLKTSVMKGTLEFEGTGVTGHVTVWRARPGEMLATIEAGPYGRLQDGVHGTIAWSSSTMAGPRVKEGDEQAVAIRDAAFDVSVRWRAFYDAETVAAVDVADAPCWKVKLSPKAGAAVFQYFDRSSGLLVRTDATMPSAMGELAVVTVLGDWREVDGIRLPFEMTQAMGDIQKLRIVTKSIEHNVEIPADRFAPPEDVQRLVDARAKEGEVLP
jgi:hypothetical protein